MSIAKFDVDVQMSEKLLEKFVYTRLRIVECLGYTPMAHQCIVSEKGYHFWFKVREVLSDQELCDLQFLLGDDQPRCRFNYLRNEAGVFKVFNALFNKKLKRKKAEEIREEDEGIDRFLEDTEERREIDEHLRRDRE